MHSPSARSRLLWRASAFAAMLAVVFCVWRYLDAVGRISGWVGLPQYQPEIPRYELYSRLSLAGMILLPFVAAFLLGFARTKPSSYGAATSYLLRLLFSVVVPIAVFFLLIMIERFGLHSG